jgi:hypothetical protein
MIWKILKYTALFAFMFALIVVLLIGIDNLADTDWLWHR